MRNEELVGYLPIIGNVFNYGIPIKNEIENYVRGKKSVQVTIRSKYGEIDMPATNCSISISNNLILLPLKANSKFVGKASSLG